ncbi:MAG: GAF domain-containing sensor histidine kinase [Bdellovibrionia bacterium]
MVRTALKTDNFMQANLALERTIKSLNRVSMKTERARQDSSHLMRIGDRLSSSLEYDINLSRIAQLIIPSLGDWCLIELLNSDGTLNIAQVAYSNANITGSVGRGISRLNPNLNSIKIRDAVIKSGKSKIIPRANRNISLEEPNLKLKIIPRSAMFVPLLIRERVIGIFTLLLDESDRNFSRDDLILAEEIAHRSAIALDNSRRYTEVKAAIAERDESLSVISHELKTPLTALSLQNQFLLKIIPTQQMGTPLWNRIRSILQSSLLSIKQLDYLIKNSLDPSKLNYERLSITRSKVNLTEIIYDIILRCSNQFQEANCQVKTNLPKECFGYFDRPRIEQVFTNLLMNATKYAAGKPISITLYDLGTPVEIRIQDSGKGISLEDQRDIFLKFKRAPNVVGKIEGLGLGLYIVEKIIRAHAGTIRIESSPEMGTTFVITIPKKIPLTNQNGQSYA